MFFADPVAAFTNIGRALRPASRLVLLVWQERDRDEWATAIRQTFTAAPATPRGPDPFSLADPTVTEGILAAAGFAEVSACLDRHGPPPSLTTGPPPSWCQETAAGSDLLVTALKETVMGKIIYWVHASVDGFIDGPNGEFDWPVMGPELSAYSEGLGKRVDTLLFGRPVWQMMVGFWPNAESLSDDAHVAAFAPFWRATPKIVFSRGYQGDEWTHRVISTNLAEEVAALKARPSGGDMLLTGGAALAAALTELGLIDEYHIAVHPVVLGGGRQLFAAPEHRHNLRLVEARALDGQVVVSQYQLTSQ